MEGQQSWTELPPKAWVVTLSVRSPEAQVIRLVARLLQDIIVHVVWGHAYTARCLARGDALGRCTGLSHPPPPWLSLEKCHGVACRGPAMPLVLL